MKLYSVILGAALAALVLAGPASAWDSVQASTERGYSVTAEKGYSGAEMRHDAHDARMSTEKEPMHGDARGYVREAHDSNTRTAVELSIDQSRENGAM